MKTETLMITFNSTIVMQPELVNRNTPLTTEIYQNDIKDVTEILKHAVTDGFLTETQKKRVLDKMEENLTGLEYASPSGLLQWSVITFIFQSDTDTLEY